MPSANDLRKGMAIKYNNDVVVVLDMQHRTPGNLRAFVQATIRSLKTGKSAVIRFSSTEPIEQVMMTTRKLEFSYKDQTGFHFMDPETYDTEANPNAEPYVRVGDHVDEATTVCIIEAMKVFNEIPAEVSGRVLAVLARAASLSSQA